MQYTRRQVLVVTGGSLSTALVAGCLSDTGAKRTPASGFTAGGDPNGPGDRDAGGPTQELPDDLDRIDVPPYEIERESCGSDSDRDPIYLSAQMPAEPSLPFEHEETARSILLDDGLGAEGSSNGDLQLYATLLTDEDDLERVDLEPDTPATALIEDADFDENTILIAQTGWGSSAETPFIKRIEETEDGIHAFGCYRRPCLMTADYTYRTTVVRVDRPDELESGLVSLTGDPDTRVNFAAGEGVVTLEDDWARPM
ncbi:hypothetical protein [Halostagnicola bangensis]